MKIFAPKLQPEEQTWTHTARARREIHARTATTKNMAAGSAAEPSDSERLHLPDDSSTSAANDNPVQTNAIEEKNYIWSNPRDIFVLRPLEGSTITNHIEDKHYEYNLPLIESHMRSHMPGKKIHFLEGVDELVTQISNHFKNASSPILVISQGFVANNGFQSFGPEYLVQAIQDRIPEQFQDRIKIVVRSREKAFEKNGSEPMIIGSMNRKPFYTQLQKLNSLIHEYVVDEVGKNATIPSNLITTSNFDQYLSNKSHDLLHTLGFLLDYISESQYVLNKGASVRNKDGDYPRVISQYLQKVYDNLISKHNNFISAAKSLEVGSLRYCWEEIQDELKRLHNGLCRLMPDAERVRYDLVTEEYANGMQHLYHELIGQSRQYSNHEINLVRLLEDLGERWSKPLAKAGISLKINNQCSGAIYSDERALSAVLNNLMGNAIKHLVKHPGLARNITIDLSDSRGLFKFTVTNPGQLDDDIDEVTMFFHGESSDPRHERNYGGETGLGLSSARDICRALGGNLSCRANNNEVSLIGQVSSVAGA